MKQNEILSSTPHDRVDLVEDPIDDVLTDDHEWNGNDTPLRADAFNMSNAEKIREIAYHFKQIMHTLGLDLSDDSLKGTPQRVARMYVNEIFSGLDPANKPDIALFANKYKYDQMLVEKDITLFSNCEHHFVPIYGFAHVAYISSGKVIGLSKINRVVQYYAKRPQVQERLTMQIGRELQEILSTQDVAVVIDARHMCVSMRGVQDNGSSTVTTFYGGKFGEEDVRSEFLQYLK